MVALTVLGYEFLATWKRLNEEVGCGGLLFIYSTVL